MVLGPKTGSVDGICQQTDSMNRFYLDVKTGPMPKQLVRICPSDRFCLVQNLPTTELYFRQILSTDFINRFYHDVKVAVNTIVPRSPFFFVFVPQNPDCYTHRKKRGRISPSMEWRYLCYLQLVSKAKNPLTPMAK